MSRWVFILRRSINTARLCGALQPRRGVKGQGPACVLSQLTGPVVVSPPAVLEVHQFSRDAGVAEAWLLGQEPYLSSREMGQSVDEVEKLIKRHEAFEKSAATWEERFSALERLTTVRAPPSKPTRTGATKAAIIVFVMCVCVCM